MISGITVKTTRYIKKIGHCTNLTLESVEGAYAAGVDLLITHHDAWAFIYGLQATCFKKLETYDIGHYLGSVAKKEYK